MWLTFSGRVHVVRKKPQEECNQIAKVMIACCQKTFDDYPTLAEHYIRARIDHINSALPGRFIILLVVFIRHKCSFTNHKIKTYLII